MRFRILVIMMLALWIPLAGHAELAIDLSTATLEELLAARDAIQARIEEIEKEAAEARISVGVYKIGEDLEPGIYVLMEEDDALLPSFILRDAETEETLEFEIISNQMVVMLEKGQIMHLSEARVYPIAEAPIALECRVFDVVHSGTHDIFMADIVNVSCDDKLLDDNGKIHFDKAKLIAYSHGEYYALGKKLGRFGFSTDKKKKGAGKRSAPNGKVGRENKK